MVPVKLGSRVKDMRYKKGVSEGCIYSKSPMYKWYCSKSTFISPICKSNKVRLYTQLTQSAIQYCSVIGL